MATEPLDEAASRQALAKVEEVGGPELRMEAIATAVEFEIMTRVADSSIRRTADLNFLKVATTAASSSLVGALTKMFKN